MRLRDSRIALTGAALSAALLVAGCSSVPGHPVAAPNTTPFYSAVLDLMTQQVAHYTGTNSQGGTWDMRTTAAGEMLGSVGAQGQPQVGVLSIGGKTYVKPSAGSQVSDLPSGVSPSSVAGKWVSGSDDLAKLVPAGAQSPYSMAAALMQALDKAHTFPRVGDSTVQVGADQAYEVVTPDGTLDVSATAPYHLLRWDPERKDQHPSATTTPDSLVLGGGSTPADDDSLGPIAFTVMTPADRDQAFKDIIAQTQSLTDAVDVGIQFKFQQSGDLKCTNDSCTVSTSVSTTTTTAHAAQLSGNVSAVMKASLTVDGTPSAGCSAAQTLPINGNSVMNCVDASVAPIIARINAQHQAQADAQARAQNRDVKVEYSISIKSHVEVQAVAMVQAEIDKLVTVVRAEQDTRRNRDTCGQSCTYQQIPYGSDKLSQAADRTRRTGNPGSGANILIAVVPGWNDPANGDLVIGSGDAQPGDASGRSEDDLLSKLTARDFNPGQITSLYSERQPCFTTCNSKLSSALPPNTAVSYSIPWLLNDTQATDAGNRLLDKLAMETELPHK
ncbi:nucleic acid/nucleotide deaminase domain-containing protein [Nocardia niigatensis]